VQKNSDGVSYSSTREILRDHGFIVTLLYWGTEVASWFSLGHWLRALPRIDSIGWALDEKSSKPAPWWQDLVALLYFALTPLALSMAWSGNSRTSGIGSFISVYLLFDPLIYHVRVLWFDDLKPGIPDSRRGVWSHRRILFLAIGAYVQSIILFPAIYRQVDQLSDLTRSELASRSLAVATSLSLAEPVTYADLAQLSFSLFLLVIVIATTASIAYRRKEIAGARHKHENEAC
jgi:hypothetical protein